MFRGQVLYGAISMRVWQSVLNDQLITLIQDIPGIVSE